MSLRRYILEDNTEESVLFSSDSKNLCIEALMRRRYTRHNLIIIDRLTGEPIMMVYGVPLEYNIEVTLMGHKIRYSFRDRQDWETIYSYLYSFYPGVYSTIARWHTPN